MSNTPAAPAQKAEASVRTWVNSQWQLHPKPGQISATINTLLEEALNLLFVKKGKGKIMGT
jgi:hypothetical protein